MRILRLTVGVLSVCVLVTVLAWLWVSGGVGGMVPFGIGLLLIPSALGMLLLFSKRRAAARK